MKKLQVFLSSAMTGELNTERELIRLIFQENATLSKFFDLYAIEEHASPQTIEVAYTEEVENSDIVLFIFENQLRDAVLKEYQSAKSMQKRSFIYLKNSDKREKRLQDFINSEIYKFNPGKFSEPSTLCEKVKSDIQDDLVKIYTKSIRIKSEQENVEYTRQNNISPQSTYRFFKIDDLLSLDLDNEFIDLSSDQLLSLSSLSIEKNGNYKVGLAIIELALLKDPDNWMLHNNRGLILQTIGLSDAAQFSYNKAIELFPENDTAYYNLGGVFYKLGKYSEAVICYKSSIQINQQKQNAISQIAACYLRLNNHEEALKWSLKAIEISKDEITIINLIVAYVMNNDFYNALESLELLENTSFSYKNVYSYIVYKQGEYEKAIKLIDELNTSGYMELDGAKTKFYCLLKLGFEKDAFEWFKKFESFFPITAYEYNDLGHKYIEIFGKSEYANYFFEKSIALDEGLLVPRQNLQFNLAQLQRYKESKEVCENTLKLVPFDKISIQNKNAILAETGNFSEMMQFMFQKVFSLISDEANENTIKDIFEKSFKDVGIDMKKFDELFRSIYTLNKLLNSKE